MEHYQALFEPDPKAGGYVATFPDFGYGVTQGETEEEAVGMAQELLMLTIGDYIRECKPLPAGSRRRGAKFRSVSATGSRIRQGRPVHGVPGVGS
jgi:predicted RNase H-like HicB family nuclease